MSFADPLTIGSLSIDPPLDRWRDAVPRPPASQLFGQSSEQWRRITRLELRLPSDVPLLATGHQPVLWHCGILAKYIAVDQVAATAGVAAVNLIVDQHEGPFGSIEVPLRGRDGAWVVRSLELFPTRPDVVMACHPAVQPHHPPPLAELEPFVQRGLEHIIQCVSAHGHAPNAAHQMASAMASMMEERIGVRPMPPVTATDLMGTSLAAAMLKAMIEDPQRCALEYNRAARSVPEAGIEPLLVRDDYVELPVWRLDADGRRHRAYDHDVERALDQRGRAALGDGQPIPRAGDLLPRALMMTALMRLAACDLFVHGAGGVVYDKVMERWVSGWLQASVASAALATATVRLPLDATAAEPGDLERHQHRLRHAWHDPDHVEEGMLSRFKVDLLSAVNALPARSMQRREAFLSMHARLAQRRTERAARLRELDDAVGEAMRARADALVARRRDWAWPLHPDQSLHALSAGIRRGLSRVERSS